MKNTSPLFAGTFASFAKIKSINLKINYLATFRLIIILPVWLLIFVQMSVAQTMRTFDLGKEDTLPLKSEQSNNQDYDALIAIQSDLSLSAVSNGDDDENKAGIGSLGIFFLSKNWYGDVNFAVLSAQKDIETNDTAESAAFVNNLLIPQKGGRGISSFGFSLGVNQPFYNALKDKKKWLQWIGENIGLYGQFRSNSLIWTKDLVSVPVVVNSTGLYITCNVFNFDLLGDERQSVHFSILGGAVFRRLGGDYGLDENRGLREYFLGTDKRGFNGTEFGAKLEIGQIYSRMSLTTFSSSDNLPGFSGSQLLVTIGAVVELNIKAKKRK